MPLHAQKRVSLPFFHVSQLHNVSEGLYRHPTCTRWIVSSLLSKSSSLKGRPAGRQPFRRFMITNGSMSQPC